MSIVFVITSLLLDVKLCFKFASPFFNIILPKNEQISKDLSLNNDITKIFNGNDNIPEMEYICYEHWLKHKNYNNIAEILDKIRFLDNSIIEKAFNHEANYFLERLTKRYVRLS